MYDQTSPGMTDDLKLRIKQKQIIFRLPKHDLISKECYRSFCRQIEKKLLRNNKSRYHKTKLKYATNSSDKWKHLRNIIGLDSKNKITINTILSESGKKVSDKLEFANTFNEYFSSVGPNTARSKYCNEYIPRSHKSF